MNRIRSRIVPWLAFFMLTLMCHVVVAQAPVAAPVQAPVAVPNAPVQAPASGGVIVRPLWTEIFITVIMVGGALFAVGRSSNRS